MADYARLLSGPKGTPVRFIDRHPMRVFKWSPDFDAYCESLVAAIWCNLIGLPIHLFDHAALFAIGKLLGNPIQVDRAMANKSRLSFARISVEIDITKPPPEEIICGRETIQQVKWDKIPAYCMECRHVGHRSEVCYAAGKAERPLKRNYNNVTPKQQHHVGHGSQGETVITNHKDRTHQGKAKEMEEQLSRIPNKSVPLNREWSGPDIMGELQDGSGTAPVSRAGDEGRGGRGGFNLSRGSAFRSFSQRRGSRGITQRLCRGSDFIRP
ncbi:uncharacterized protein LOC121776068 [Salvia splendens]|uniref:uncharacterized protein LOC121776068 n=1 Tax=Salvia splendens TaxID=180675 RepID=UPI001C26316B|nr:uncharacterized protein LOC121776068 [Salvia splendens]